MPSPEIRQRALPRSIKGHHRYVFNGSTLTDERREFSVDGTQRTVSEGHPVSQLGKTDDDIGGDFETFKSEVPWISHPSATVRADGNPYLGEFFEYEGGLIPSLSTPLKREAFDLRSSAQLNALGSTAIARCSPVNSHSELLTSLSETLKDGLPAIPGISQWRQKTAIAKGAGSEYLNAQFGWVPLVNDIRSATAAARDAAKLLRQFQRDAGRSVRRTYEFPRETDLTTTTVYDGPYASNYLNAGGFDPLHPRYFPGGESGRYKVTREFDRKVWFSGAFTYHMPANDTQVGKFMSALQQYDLLFGVVPTPDVIWNLTPWSWATDWFANTGDVLTNVSNAMLYGQVLRYGYLMEKTTIKDRHVLELPGFIGPQRIESVVKTTVKRRIRANPFGFGITYDGLDGYQLSILAALGMTRR